MVVLIYYTHCLLQEFRLTPNSQNSLKFKENLTEMEMLCRNPLYGNCNAPLVIEPTYMLLKYKYIPVNVWYLYLHLPQVMLNSMNSMNFELLIPYECLYRLIFGSITCPLYVKLRFMLGNLNETTNKMYLN